MTIDPVILESVCPICDRKTTTVVDGDKLHRWQAGGEKIQEVFPHLSNMERETLMSGVCSERCWREFVGFSGAH